VHRLACSGVAGVLTGLSLGLWFSANSPLGFLSHPNRNALAVFSVALFILFPCAEAGSVVCGKDRPTRSRLVPMIASSTLAGLACLCIQGFCSRMNLVPLGFRTAPFSYPLEGLSSVTFIVAIVHWSQLFSPMWGASLGVLRVALWACECSRSRGVRVLGIAMVLLGLIIADIVVFRWTDIIIIDSSWELGVARGWIIWASWLAIDTRVGCPFESRP